MVVIVLRAEVVECVAAARLPVTRDLALLDLQPVDLLRASREASAADVTVAVVGVDNDGIVRSALSSLNQRGVVEQVDTVDFCKVLQTIKTSSLLVIGRNLVRLTARAEQGVGASSLLQSLRNLELSGCLLVSTGTQSASTEWAEGSARNNRASSSQTKTKHLRVIQWNREFIDDKGHAICHGATFSRDGGGSERRTNQAPVIHGERCDLEQLESPRLVAGSLMVPR